MRSFIKFGQWGCAATVIGVLILSAGSAYGALDICQKEIETRSMKFHAKVTAALQKCQDFARKEIVKEMNKPDTGFLAGAAKSCETQLAKIYGHQGTLAFTGKTEVTKFREAMNKARAGKCTKGSNNGVACSTNDDCTNVPSQCVNLKCAKSTTNGAACTVPADCPEVQAVCNAKCRDEDLDAIGGLGHLLSGNVTNTTAPPTNAVDPLEDDESKFLIDWLLFAKEHLAIKQQLAMVPGMLTLFKDMVEAAPAKISLTSGIAAKKGTDCSGTPDANTEEYRPNLCRFGLECREHACQLDTSGTCSLSAVACDNAPGSPATCGGGFDYCVAGESYVSLDSALISGVIVPILGSQMIELCRPGPGASGQGAGSEFGAEDDIYYLINQPGRTLIGPDMSTQNPILGGLIEAACVETVSSEGWCDCASGGSGAPLDTSVCVDHITSDNPGPNDDCGSPLTAVSDDSEHPGTKNGRLNITAGGSSVEGDCFDVVTLQFKLITSAGDLGTDGIPCTDDDTVAPTASISIPITTGDSTAIIKDGVSLEGGCSGDSGTTPCIEDVNCDVANGGPGGTCTDPAPTIGDITVGPVMGATGSCDEYLASNLSGVAFVGAAGIPDADDQLGDAVVGFRLKCK